MWDGGGWGDRMSQAGAGECRLESVGGGVEVLGLGASAGLDDPPF